MKKNKKKRTNDGIFLAVVLAVISIFAGFVFKILKYGIALSLFKYAFWPIIAILVIVLVFAGIVLLRGKKK